MTHNRFGFDEQIDREIKKELLDMWDTEPDSTEVKFEGYHLVIARNQDFGNLNGYVGLNRNHPYYRREMSHKTIDKLIVHGGVTFTGKFEGYPFRRSYWYVGFDTLHFYDYAPKLHELLLNVQKEFVQDGDEFSPLLNSSASFLKSSPLIADKKNYRNFEYVANEIISLYHQLDAVKKKSPLLTYSHKKEYRLLHKQKNSFSF